MSMPRQIVIQECCPRDGWQNHSEFIPTETKIRYIKRMLDSGLKMIEVTSFVSPKAVPQMRDAKDVFAVVLDYAREKDIILTALALNKRGVVDAKNAGASTVEFVLSASEEHNLRNSKRTIQESMDTFKELAKNADGLDVILCLPCAFGSPFGDEVPLDRLKWIAEEAHSVGVHKFGLADTAGISTPFHTREILHALSGVMDMNSVSVHFHDTYGLGIANAYVALEEGITRFDSSLAAMGGCPFVPGAKGNIATEDLVNMCENMGISTGCDLNMLIKVAKDMCDEIHVPLKSSTAIACNVS